MQGAVEHVLEYFSKKKSGESSTYQEVLGVFNS